MMERSLLALILWSCLLTSVLQLAWVPETAEAQFVAASSAIEVKDLNASTDVSVEGPHGGGSSFQVLMKVGKIISTSLRRQPSTPPSPAAHGNQSPIGGIP